MATSQKLQLGTLNPEYSRFVKDQVLTEVQLNELIDFFEDQHRLSRTCLFGTGIVCGLKLKSSRKGVALYPGVAVTTDGDLLRMDERLFTHAVVYQAPEECRYDPFYYQAAGAEGQLTLYRLLTEKEAEEAGQSTDADVLKIGELSTKIKDYVALLYLEYYSRKPEKCTPVSCENMGSRQVARPLVLALSRQDAERLTGNDSGDPIHDTIYTKYHQAASSWFKLPVILPKRVIISRKATLTSSTLAGAYRVVYREGSDALCKAIGKLYKTFSFMIDKGKSSDPDKLIERLHGLLTAETSIYQAQYTYDFYKDMVAAYNELRDQLYSIAFECIPDLFAFPKHVMLGAPNAPFTPEPQEYRHVFYPSPAITSRNERVNRAIGMWLRLQVMVETFNTAKADAIRITPSNDYNRPLEERAIPFYYPGFEKIAQEWNYDRKLMKQTFLNYSCHNPEIKEPLDLDIDPYDFFRIEGHIGKDWKTAMTELDVIRKEKGVPIDLAAVRLGDVRAADVDLNDFECRFEDLDVMLKAFQTETDCLITDATRFYSGFTPSVEKPHVNFSKYLGGADNPWVISAAASSLIAQPAAEKPEIATGRIVSPASRVGSEKLSSAAFFKVSRTVETGMDTSAETFGKYYAKVLEADVASADEFMEKARAVAANDPELTKLNEDQRYITFEYPMQIIGNLAVIQKYTPAGVKDITDDLIGRYRAATNDFCKRLQVMRTRAEKYFATAGKTGYEAKYLAMADKLSAICCGSEKLELIRKEMEKRKAAILEQLSFARYAEDHPGLEHKAGVPRGGTFVMVYAATPVKRFPTDRLTASVAAAVTAGKTEAARAYQDTDRFAVFVAENEEKIDKEKELDNYFKANNIIAGSAYSNAITRLLNEKISDIKGIITNEIRLPEKDRIIADFCLPYVCKSSCPPVSFIIQKAEEEPEEPTEPTEPVEPEPEPQPEPEPEPEPEPPVHDEKCAEFVQKFIDQKLAELSSVNSTRLIRVANSREMVLFLRETVALLKKLKEMMAAGAVNEKPAIIKRIGELLARLYEIGLSPEAGGAVRIGEELIRTLLMLMLNLVRCEKELNEEFLSLLRENLSQFNDRNEKLVAGYPELDKGNILEKQVAEFLENHLSKNPELIKILKVTMKLLTRFAE